jgi:hypothetical protein
MSYADIIVKNCKLWYENGNKKSNHHHFDRHYKLTAGLNSDFHSKITWRHKCSVCS